MNGEERPYDDTVDESRQRSLEKALAILEERQKKEERVSKMALERPDVSIKRGIVILGLALTTVFFLLPYALSFHIEALETRLLISLIAGVTVFLIFARKAVVWMILAYQKLSPEKIRRACVFEPTCSEYMLKAIDKYGTMSGVIKGVKRLLRCHHPNGGIDVP